MISRHSLFEKYPWMEAGNERRFIIMGDDLDAALSACLLLARNPRYKLAGIYNAYHELVLSKDYYDELAKNLPNTIWIDLDIHYHACPSLGHHMIRYSSKDRLSSFQNSCNLNEIFSKTLQNHFQQKYPLGTIHFLMWLYDLKTPAPEWARFLIWLADSSFINAQSHRFRSNVRIWLKNHFQMDFLVDDFEHHLESVAFEEKMRDFQKILHSKGFAQGFGQVRSKHLGLTGYQCQPKRLPDDMISLLRFVSNTLQWSVTDLQIGLKGIKKIRGKRVSIPIDQMLKDYGDLDNFLQQQKVFSYVFPYKNTLNYTCF